MTSYDRMEWMEKREMKNHMRRYKFTSRGKCGEGMEGGIYSDVPTTIGAVRKHLEDVFGIKVVSIEAVEGSRYDSWHGEDEDGDGTDHNRGEKGDTYPIYYYLSKGEDMKFVMYRDKRRGEEIIRCLGEMGIEAYWGGEEDERGVKLNIMIKTPKEMCSVSKVVFGRGGME